VVSTKDVVASLAEKWTSKTVIPGMTMAKKGKEMLSISIP